MTLAALGAENDRVISELGDMRENRAILDATFRHDLRHPLQAITGAAALLEDVDRPLEDSERVELLAMISSEAERLNVMLDATFADSVGHDHVPPKLERIEIKELVATVAASGRSANSGRISLDVEQSELTTDPARLGRALRNLIDNALKYAPADDTVDIFGRVTGDDYCIQVIDGGPGVEPQLVHRLFTPFFRDADRIDSTGLGLASVARLVESLGGRAAYSRAERTVFEIVVPRDSSRKGTHETR
jgi:signal transduction histidine kinase